MNTFAAIDFETANNERTSVCSVGVVIVREGEFVDSFYSHVYMLTIDHALSSSSAMFAHFLR